MARAKRSHRSVAKPEPPRPLASAGRALWDRAWEHGSKWLTPADVDLLLLTCEQVDERQALRLVVLRDGDWRQRTALRALDRSIQDGLHLLGLAPRDREPTSDGDDDGTAAIQLTFRTPRRG